MKAAAACWTAAVIFSSIIAIVLDMCRCFEVRVPKNYTAMQGDLEVVVSAAPPERRGKELRLELLRVTDDKEFEIIGSVLLPSLTRNSSTPTNGTTENVLTVKFKCGLITMGGRYRIRIQVTRKRTSNKTLKSEDQNEENWSTEKEQEDQEKIKRDSEVVELDVRWPSFILQLKPQVVETYPETPVTASLEFPSLVCSPLPKSIVPELWLDLLFCGSTVQGCIQNVNTTRKQVVYSEQVRGYPRHRTVVLKCNLFGVAGHYALSLRTSRPSDIPLITNTSYESLLKVEWSEKFVFNVHARSIIPCDILGGGIPVLFQYPACILENADRVRLFARLRADVSSLAPPTTLHYIAEQRVSRGKHKLQFDCDLFTERYVEYCFVYVNQAITGAVSNVRMDCVPTLPVSESDSGGWGKWSEWTPCSTSCGVGTRNRYRVCDSPPPKYGAKFCEGPSLESQKCGSEESEWDCLYPPTQHNSDMSNTPAERPEIRAEVGPGCRCGCILHLSSAKSRRLLATSAHGCPGRTFWLIQADRGHVVKLTVEFVRLPCEAQWLKVRDGDSPSSTLVAHLVHTHQNTPAIVSSGSYLLIEFFTDELLAAGIECGGGFLAHAQQIVSQTRNSSHPFVVLTTMSASPVYSSLTAVHLASVVFVLVIIVVSACLGLQYVHRYRKYQLAKSKDDSDSAIGSQLSMALIKSRAASTSTLLSEVISLKKFRSKPAHDRLQEEDGEEEAEQESQESEPEYEVIETECKDVSKPLLSPEQKSPHNITTTTPLLPDRPDTISSKRAETKTARASKEPSPAAESELENFGDVDSVKSYNLPEKKKIVNMKSRTRAISGASIATLTNGSHSSVVSYRRNDRNPKERKDKRNMERLLAGSDFSLAGHDTDLELDYYDYNVSNAGAVPGSYLGMDPAYLVWIPPFAPGRWEEDDNELLRDGDRDHYLSQLELSQLTAGPNPYSVRLVSDLSDREQTNQEIEMEEVTFIRKKPKSLDRISYASIKTITNSSEKIEYSDNLDSGEEKTAIKEMSFGSQENKLNDSGTIKRHRPRNGVDRYRESPARVHYQLPSSEKETQVLKSPIDNKGKYDIMADDDDIKFADDEEDDTDTQKCEGSVIKESNKSKHVVV